MPIRSMTGFGLAERLTPSGTYHIEVRSVNNRFLEVQLRQPRFAANLEPKIRKEIGNAVSRGSIQVSINCDREENEVTLTWNEQVSADYIRIFNEIGTKFSLPMNISVADLLKFDNIITSKSLSFNEEELWSHCAPVLNDAISAFQTSRETEGTFIVAELKTVLNGIAATLDCVEKRASQRIPEYAAALKERVQKLIADPPDPQRMTTEIALCADRLDISEECTRLRAHIEKLYSDFASDGAVGKRMGFLLQEMNREANTIGSKANDTEISHLSLALKESIEKIREQIQNIE